MAILRAAEEGRELATTHWIIAEHRGRQGLAAVEQDWRRLFAEMPNPATWHSFEAYSVYLDTLCPDANASRVLTLSDGERVRAIMPLEERGDPGLGGRLRVWGVPLHNCWRPTDVIGPEDDAREALLPAAVAYLRRVHGRPSVLVVGQSSAGSALWQGLAALGSVRSFSFPDGAEFVVPTDQCPEDFLEGLSASSRSTIRRAEKRLERYPDARYVRAVEPSEVAEEFEHFLAVESSGWKGERGTAIANNPELIAFYRGLTERVVTDGHVEIHAIHAEDRCIAAEFDVYLPHRVDGLKGGYDEAYRRLSPGRLMTHQTLLWSCEDGGIDLVSGVSDAPWLRTWHPAENGLRRGYVALTPIRGTLMILVLRVRYGPMRRLVRAYNAWRRRRDDSTVRRPGRDSG